MDIYEEISDSLLMGNAETTESLVRKALGKMYPAEMILERGLIGGIKKMEENIRILDSKNNNLMNENTIAQERIGILSWIVGEWSDWLETPLSEIKDINGAVVLGVELESLVRGYPGPYAAEAFCLKC